MYGKRCNNQVVRRDAYEWFERRESWWEALFCIIHEWESAFCKSH